MHDQHKRKVEHRIVSIEQPWVRPIVRGKTHANAEFGEKIHLSIENGWSLMDFASFEAYNEATRLKETTETVIAMAVLCFNLKKFEGFFMRSSCGS